MNIDEFIERCENEAIAHAGIDHPRNLLFLNCIKDLAQAIKSENTMLLRCMPCSCKGGFDSYRGTEKIKSSPLVVCPRCKLLEERGDK